jgi:hypothetical protein
MTIATAKSKFQAFMLVLKCSHRITNAVTVKKAVIIVLKVDFRGDSEGVGMCFHDI